LPENRPSVKANNRRRSFGWSQRELKPPPNLQKARRAIMPALK
jgi:hypothetical protein